MNKIQCAKKISLQNYKSTTKSDTKTEYWRKFEQKKSDWWQNQITARLCCEIETSKYKEIPFHYSKDKITDQKFGKIKTPRKKWKRQRNER